MPAGIAAPPKGARVTVPLGTRAVTGCVVGSAADAPDRADAPRRHRGARRRAVPAAGSSSIWRCGSASTTHRPRRRAGRRDAAVGAQTGERDVVPDGREWPSWPSAAALDAETLKGVEAARGRWRCCAASPTASSLPALARDGHQRRDGALARATEAGRRAARGRRRARSVRGGADGDGGASRGRLTRGDARRPRADGGAGRRVPARSKRGGATARVQDGRCCMASPAAARRSSTCDWPRRVVASGRRVLVLVPEIALTPAVGGLFRGAIRRRASPFSTAGCRTASDTTSGIASAAATSTSSSARGRRCSRRSSSVGLIVVDEEHDGVVQAGRVAALSRPRRGDRARPDGAARWCVLGSATPSLESAVERREPGGTSSIVLTRRILDRPLATVRIVDMRQEYAAHGAGRHAEPAAARGHRRAARAQASRRVVLLNRRGFATVIFCRQCGASLECPHCSVSLTYHRAARRRAVPLLQLRRRRCRRRCGAVRRRVSRAVGLRHRAARGRAAASGFPTPASRASIATRFAAAARSRGC